MRPASYQDFVDGKALYYRRTRYNAHHFENEFTPVSSMCVNTGPLKSSMVGDHHACAWSIDGIDYGFHGKLFVRQFRDASSFRIETSCDPSLWVAE